MSQNIAVLEPQVAAKIAAGEVIERPSAVVRELMDNAIDAGATQVSLYLEEGGLQLIRVTDDGIGMSREDLELCYLAHATSKIRRTSDLLQLCSLGFRGEALGSIAACSKLRISSAQRPEASAKITAFELQVSESLLQGLQQSTAAHSGTQVEVRELFYSFPARRKFLKSVRSELHHCKVVFLEKALVFPHIHFRLYNNSKMEQSLAPASRLERICQIYGDLLPEQLHTLSERTEHFALQIFAAAPVLYRRDRKRMPIYINQRPIAESSLQQAIRIGFDGYLAGGLFPICFCFLEVMPERVDFNIHPAKREARLRDLNLIQAGIRQTLRNFCREYGALTPLVAEAGTGPEIGLPPGNPAASYSRESLSNGTTAQTSRSPASGRRPAGQLSRVFSPHPSSACSSRNNDGSSLQGVVGRQGFSVRDLPDGDFSGRGEDTAAHAGAFAGESLREHAEAFRPASWHPGEVQLTAGFAAEDSGCGFRYLGQLFQVFLLVERELAGVPQLLIVDQHASHERILYETLEQEMLQQQSLLLPIEFEAEKGEEEGLLQRIEGLGAIGIQLRQTEGSDGESIWQICSLPSSVSDLKEELIELVRHGASEAEDLKRELFAHLSCHKAIKKGDILDPISANQLLQTLFSMGLERCPHGRPLWYSLSQPELYRLIQRT